MTVARRHLLPRFGRTESIAAGLAAFGVAVWVVLVAPLGRQVDALEAQVSELADRDREQLSDAVTRQQAAEVRRFIEHLPDDRLRAGQMALLPSLAKKHGVSLSQVSMDESGPPTRGTELKALNGRITGEGGYAEIRNWLNQIWREMPSLAITSLRLARRPGGGKLQLRLEFDYYSRLAGNQGAAMKSRFERPLPALAALAGDPFGRAGAGAAQAKPKPAADPVPSLPFTYGGSFRTGGQELHLLIEGDEVHRIRVGETFSNGVFRLESADRSRLELTHLPSARRSSLLTGNPSP